MALAADTAVRALSFAESDAMGACKPIIDASNAASFMPPSLNAFRTAASRAAGSAPAAWYQAMTGSAWDGQGHSYDLAKKRHRRFLDGYKTAEQERERKRDRSRRDAMPARPSDDQPGELSEWLAVVHERYQRAMDRVQRWKQRSQDHVLNHDRVFTQLMQQAGVDAPDVYLEAAHFIQLVDNVQTKGKRDRRLAMDPRSVYEMVSALEYTCTCYALFREGLQARAECPRLPLNRDPSTGACCMPDDVEKAAASCSLLGFTRVELQKLMGCSWPMNPDGAHTGCVWEDLAPRVSVCTAIAIADAAREWLHCADVQDAHGCNAECTICARSMAKRAKALNVPRFSHHNLTCELRGECAECAEPEAT
mmetsp:Transcript_19672/g.33517  ORF Transcript_19672/g.33517 Transcript_19672/m.33517 type:complete len:365 (+) Transcript_19672:40-1134(+)